MALPPGNEAAYKALLEKQITDQYLGFNKNPILPELTNYKGKSFIYRFEEDLPAQTALVQ
jgi:hypothetical protein